MILQTESVISVSKGGNMGNLNETPSANRLHIGIYGKTNSGKSSLINAVTKQEVSIVADVAGKMCIRDSFIMVLLSIQVRTVSFFTSSLVDSSEML